MEQEKIKNKIDEYLGIIKSSEFVKDAYNDGDLEFPYFKVFTTYLLPSDDYLNLYVMPDEELRFLYFHDQRNVFTTLDDYLNITIDDVIKEAEKLGIEDWGHGLILNIPSFSLETFNENIQKFFTLCDLLKAKYHK